MKALDPFDLDLEKTTLIEASAGTGKTYTITTLYCRLVAKGFPVESILVVTFTEAAAAELKLRVRQRMHQTLERLQALSQNDSSPNSLHEDPLPNAPLDDDLVRFLNQDENTKIICQRLALGITCFDQSSILTIHSFCLKVLKENAFESRYLFDIELMPDRSVFLNQVSCDFFMARINNLDRLFLKYFDKRKITPDSFVKSFGPIVSRKNLALKPTLKKFDDFFDEYRQTVVKVRTILEGRAGEISDLLLNYNGIDKRSYSKRYVPAWLESSLQKIIADGSNTLFVMTPKGDSLFKFCSSTIALKTKDGCIPPSHEFFQLCEHLLALYQQFENNLISLKQEFLTFFNVALEKIKSTQGICFFDDLVNDLAFALESKESENLINAVRKTYNACLIDEFQDTDPAQYEIFSKLFSSKGTPFFMIGDPKQAIYAFRGGDIFAYLQASKDSLQRFTLLQNFRSAPLLVQGVNHIFSSVANPFLYDLIEFAKVTTPQSAKNRFVLDKVEVSPLQFCFLDRQEDNTHKDGYINKKTAQMMIPDITAKDIQSVLQSNHCMTNKSTGVGEKITPKDIAILVRTNAQAQQIYMALSNIGIAAYVSKSGSVYESDEAIDLHDILTAVNHPDHKEYLKAALCTGVYNFGAKQLYELEQDVDLFNYWQDQFKQYKDVWENKGFVSMIMAVFHSEHGFLKANPSLDERKLTNYYHLVELISQASIKKDLSPYYLIKWYARQLTKDFRDESVDELRLESDKKSVAIVTIHKSKGLEYPIVYLPYMWESQHSKHPENILFHDPNKNHCLTLDLGSQEFDDAAACYETEVRAEQRRLLYVALTRASAMCKIIWGGIKNVQASALGQLLHLNGCKDDTTMIEGLTQLESRSNKSIKVYSYDMTKIPMDVEEQLPISNHPLTAYPITKNFYSEWKLSSFSGLTKSSHSIGLPNNNSLDETNSLAQITLADFPKGSKAGDLFHLIFESIDFTQPLDQTQSEIPLMFERFGYLEPSLLTTGITAMNQILDTCLETNTSSFHLNDIKNDNRLNEMEFTFSVNSFKSSWVSKAFELSNPALKTSGYIDSFSKLNIADFKGFLKGFIDLIVHHQGKWYIVDYKSNYLGDTYDMYSKDALLKAMGEHHYFLQYHIYLVALNRYLKLRLKNYDYDDHFGGIFYLFIRGMHPDYTSEYGVFFDRPSKEAINFWSDNL